MSFHAGQTFTFGEQPSATKWQYLWDNDYALADGTGISDNAILNRHLSSGIVSNAEMASDTWLWEKLASVTLGSAGDSISSGTITARKYLRIIIHAIASGSINARGRFNGDTNNNYADRASTNGAADGVGTSLSSIGFSGFDSTLDKFIVADVLNVAAKEKLVVNHYMDPGSAGAGNAPNRSESVNKWANTSAQITSVTIINAGSGDFAIGSQLIVLGHD